MDKRNSKIGKKSGITLIALVITVIVMLILAGVAINVTIGENGIFRKTEEAREISIRSQLKEELELEITDLELEKRKNGEPVTKDDIAKKLENISEIDNTTEDGIEGEYKEHEFTVDKDNKVTIGEKIEGNKPEGEAKVLTQTAGADIIEIEVTATLQGGEIVSIDSLEGLTIKEDKGAAQKIYTTERNGTYSFKIKGDNKRTTIVKCQVTNAISTEKDLFTAIEKVENSGSNKVKVIGKTSLEAEEKSETYSLNVIMHEGDMILDGTNTYEGITLQGTEYRAGNISDVGTASGNASNTVVLKIRGNLTINSGIKLTTVENGYGGPKGLIVYCTGTITNGGEISMTARGAKAVGQNVYLLKKADETFEFIPAVGGAGGGGISGTGNSAKESWHGGRAGGAGSKRGTGGGASGGVCDNSTQTVISGSGSAGTSYSGGSASAGAYGTSTNASNSGNATGNGGAGSAGVTNVKGYGAGNPSRRNRRITSIICFNY